MGKLKKRPIKSLGRQSVAPLAFPLPLEFQLLAYGYPPGLSSSISRPGWSSQQPPWDEKSCPPPQWSWEGGKPCEYKTTRFNKNRGGKKRLGSLRKARRISPAFGRNFTRPVRWHVSSPSSCLAITGWGFAPVPHLWKPLEHDDAIYTPWPCSVGEKKIRSRSWFLDKPVKNEPSEEKNIGRCGFESVHLSVFLWRGWGGVTKGVDWIGWSEEKFGRYQISK